MADAQPLPAERRHQLGLVPLDARARDGASHLVSDGQTCALVRWDGSRFIFPLSRLPLDFQPTEFRP